MRVSARPPRKARTGGGRNERNTPARDRSRGRYQIIDKPQISLRHPARSPPRGGSPVEAPHPKRRRQTRTRRRCRQACIRPRACTSAGASACGRRAPCGLLCVPRARMAPRCAFGIRAQRGAPPPGAPTATADVTARCVRRIPLAYPRATLCSAPVRRHPSARARGGPLPHEHLSRARARDGVPPRSPWVSPCVRIWAARCVTYARPVQPPRMCAKIAQSADAPSASTVLLTPWAREKRRGSEAEASPGRARAGLGGGGAGSEALRAPAQRRLRARRREPCSIARRRARGTHLPVRAGGQPRRIPRPPCVPVPTPRAWKLAAGAHRAAVTDFRQARERRARCDSGCSRMRRTGLRAQI